MINPATVPVDKISHDAIEVLITMRLLFMYWGVEPLQWKRDISKAFRRVPICPEHLEFAFVIWRDQGAEWVSQHLCMPFGTVSAVYSWHRVGYVLWLIVVDLFRAPLARCVDDFFGCSRAGVVWTGGAVLTVLSRLLGFMTDPGKDADNMIQVVVL